MQTGEDRVPESLGAVPFNYSVWAEFTLGNYLSAKISNSTTAI